jgi:peptidoglycan/xylan/chitin deacetylase (PgdA/CDA1 family)
MRVAISIVLIAIASSIGIASSAPRASASAGASRLVSQGSTSKRAVALTFDAGADRGYAATILQILERNHVRATFGMTGRWAEQNPDLLRRIARDRDTFINHTYDHRSFTGYSTRSAPLTNTQRSWEIWETELIVWKLTGRTTKPYFRPPYGDYDRSTLALAGRLGYQYTIMWTVDSLGWEGLRAGDILLRCTRLLAPGVIYLMHVGSQSQDALALSGLLHLLRREGYRVETLPQLLSGLH